MKVQKEVVFYLVIISYITDFVPKNIRMRMIGDEFWAALARALGPKLVATFKLTFHPGTLQTSLTIKSVYLTICVIWNSLKVGQQK